ncbi:DNA-directed RNA polymerase, beta' subunit [Maridesulfovibrio salexigens DSM 2638]|uniref:DNA-directed RNA polymerase subunit beta' n=2 Tax=Maridesulfovibrio salexigens TaxID=880 RepID=C6C180_MARSD|nr:DNA-directed RNA polymerase subunit beta' [Maridesulfovibrio salexigens]ACS79243.1 DNA-directed RNA polymerase, beta' subunit [Maridesulfovibrio salexigens DSM 2638]
MSLDELFTMRRTSGAGLAGRGLKGIQISIASPEKIREWSFGEVKKPETINYRTFKPERDGLFCAKIFGPVKDYECNCGKYKRMKHRGIVCEKCGVEVIASKVRRERMGHIELAAPVAHIWFLKTLPSKIGTLLDITMADLEKVLYFDSYIVLDPGETPLKQYQIISEDQYFQVIDHYGEEAIEVGMGAETIKGLLAQIDMPALRHELREESLTTRSQTKKKKLTKRLKIVEAFLESGNDCQWMIMDVIPVIPPELRPLVPLDGGRFATSDLNDLYRRVINRNNRLKRLIELGAPDIIIRNEKRMLQESVDALFDNGRRGRAITGTNGRPLKSLSDMIKGKQGRFRQNLLGKRVDYSGRSVIVVGPKLKLHQCGLPKKMALELFKPFIYAELERREIATTIKSAKKMVEREDLVVWDILDDVVREYPIMLNRAPTLHRLGIQSFEPSLVEGKAIQLHPLVCSAYNADFDGDQMAVHVPLSVEAQIECRVLMMSSNNILSPANGQPIINPSQDIVLGLYYLTVERSFSKGEGMIFTAPWEVIAALDAKVVSMHARIKVRIEGELVETTPGRILVGELLPEGMGFEFANVVMTKKNIAKLVSSAYRSAGSKATVILCDRLKDLGYEHATRAAVTIGVKDLTIPAAKAGLLDTAYAEVENIEAQYREGIITRTEKYNKVVDVWTKVTNDVSAEMTNEMSTDIMVDPKTGKQETNSSFNPVFMMAHSGARGNQDQMRQLAGMRGLMAKPSGEIIETPITSSFREGLSVLQYFISTHGARKGLADTALKTANSGYLTRRLVDVVQDVTIAEHDCRTVDGLELTHYIKGGEIKERLSEKVLGRVTIYDVVKEDTGEILVPADSLIDEAAAKIIDENGINSMTVRSPLTCRAKHGICAMCYGRDLARGHVVNVGETVGIIAAQSIGEPGTQLTMRTFHIGGTASREIQQSSFEAQHNGSVVLNRMRSVRNADGHQMVLGKSCQIGIVDEQGREREKYVLPLGAKLFVEEGQQITQGTMLAEWDPLAEPFITEVTGTVKFTDLVEGKTFQERVDEATGQATYTIQEYRTTNFKPSMSICGEDGEPLTRPGSTLKAVYPLPVGAILMVKDGNVVNAGEIIARKLRETSKTKDIVGGLPRVAELFEVRKPKELGIISEIDGVVSYGPESKGKRKIVVTPEVGETKEYLVPKGRHITAQEGDFVEAGDLMTEGLPELHDILKVKGEKYLARFLVEEIQDVYRFQGVGINDKHIEVIVRQMLKKVSIVDPGETHFLVGEQVDKQRFMETNQDAVANGLKPATAQTHVLGITQASLSTASFISAASFQETTKVLTESSLCGKKDYLRGLKENVIVGRLIPAGTGFRKYARTDIIVPDQPERADKFLEELEEEPLLVNER